MGMGLWFYLAPGCMGRRSKEKHQISSFQSREENFIGFFEPTALLLGWCQQCSVSYIAGNEMVDGECKTKLQVGSYYIIFAISAFTTFYALPSILLMIFYGMVIYTLRKRMTETEALGSSSVIEKASIQVCHSKEVPL